MWLTYLYPALMGFVPLPPPMGFVPLPPPMGFVPLPPPMGFVPLPILRIMKLSNDDKTRYHYLTWE